MGLVKCRVCGRKVSEDAARQIDGAFCCPPCHDKLAQRLKAKKAAAKAAKPDAVPGPPAEAAPSQRAVQRAAAATGVRQEAAGHGVEESIQVVPESSNVPDMPDLPDYLPPSRESVPRVTAGFGPESVGAGVYIAFAGLLVYAIGRLASSQGELRENAFALVLLGLAVFCGIIAVVAGLLGVFRGGNLPRQIGGGLALVVGFFLAGYGGYRGYDAFKNAEDLHLTRKKPEPEEKTPEPGPKKTEPEPRKPEPEPKKPEPEPKKPEPEPKKLEPPKPPEPTAEEKLLAALPKLIVDAANAAFKNLPEVPEIMAFNTKSVASLEARIDEGNAKPGSRRATGLLKVRTPGGALRFPFVVQEHEKENWQLGSFDLPVSVRRVKLNAGHWEVEELPTADAAVRFSRGLKGLDAATIPAAAAAGRAPDSGTLEPYGELRVGDAPGQPLTGGAKGLVLGLPAMGKVSDILAVAKDADGWKPVALLVSSPKGMIYPLPRITTEGPKNETFKTIEILMRKSAGGSWEMSIGGFGMATDEAGFGVFANRMAQLRAVGPLPLKMAPDGDFPVGLLVRAVDTCLKANFALNRMTLDPNGPPAPLPAPIPAPEPRRR